MSIILIQRLIKYEPEQEAEGTSNPSSGDSDWAVVKPPSVRVAAIGIWI